MKIYLLFILLLVCGWNWQTHRALALSLYYAVPDQIRETLDVDQLLNGSIAPDQDFQDFVNHSYPASLVKVKEWTKTFQEAYAQKEYTKASFALGVMSHYFADSYSLPHRISGEKYPDHQLFEKLVDQEYRIARCQQEVVFQDDHDAWQWLLFTKMKSKWFPEHYVQEAAENLLAYSAQLFHYPCEDKKTIVHYFRWRF